MLFVGHTIDTYTIILYLDKLYKGDISYNTKNTTFVVSFVYP